jgi:hypothetical protein
VRTALTISLLFVVVAMLNVALFYVQHRQGHRFLSRAPDVAAPHMFAPGFATFGGTRQVSSVRAWARLTVDG